MEVLCQGDFKRSPQNIVLVGFMGCGKSAVGRELARLLNYPLVDLDVLIEKKANKTIPEIFTEKGEDGFRLLESEVLANLCSQQKNHQIISTGGGIVVKEENHASLSQLGFVVWLTAKPKTIYQRVKDSNRPLLQTEDPLTTICEMLEKRSKWYEKAAHVAIESDDLSIQEIATGVLQTARCHYCR